MTYELMGWEQWCVSVTGTSSTFIERLVTPNSTLAELN
jgi:hypothetical protein